METITAQVAKTQFGELLMKAQREPVEISKHGKRVAVLMSAEEFDQTECAINRAATNIIRSLSRLLCQQRRAPHPAIMGKMSRHHQRLGATA